MAFGESERSAVSESMDPISCCENFLVGPEVAIRELICLTLGAAYLGLCAD
jgi:hypothetical protein